MTTNWITIRIWLQMLFFGLLLVSDHPTASAQIDPDLRVELQSKGPEEAVPVIITFAGSDHSAALRLQNGRQRRAALIRSMRAAAASHQKDVRVLLEKDGARAMRSLWAIDSLAASARPDVIRRITAMPGVINIRRDRVYHKEDMLMQLGASPEVNLTRVGAPAVWALDHFGQGVTVAVVDTGADVSHPDLAPTWRGGSNSWLDPYGQYATPFDSDSDAHGTAVLGIMVGGDAGGTTIGVAPRAKWIAARMFDENDTASDSAIHQIFQWLLDPDGNPATDDAPDVINGSWALAVFTDDTNSCVREFEQDVALLNEAGIATVFAAGNYGSSAPADVSPANYTGAIAVGAVYDDDVIFDLSSRGPSSCDDRIYPDVVAPGVHVLTTRSSLGGQLYSFGTGTSFSAPHASGALALLAGAFPQATLDDLKASLVGGAVDLGDPGPDNIYGNGRINVDDISGAFAYLDNTLGLTACVRPDISFSADPQRGAIGQPMTFTAAVDSGSGPFTFQWDVDGDGTTDYTTDSPVNAVQHTYTAAYAGGVRLRVTDNTAACAAEIVVANEWACPEITAAISAQPDPAYAGLQTTLSGTASGGVAPYTFAWDLDGDGTFDCSTAECTNIYSAISDVTIRLSVSDADGCSASNQATLRVIAPPPPEPAGQSGSSGGCFIATALNQD